MSLLWFGGLNSNMDGTKALYLSNFSKKNKINFLDLIILVMALPLRNLMIV